MKGGCKLNKAYIKFAASVLAVILAFTMIVATSYAWLTMSKSPAVNGINVAIAGGNSILLAPDITKTITEEDGTETIIHYPGAFEDTLVFSQHNTYDYIKNISGLSPVSSADGLYWMLPTYDENTGKINNISDFEVDGILENANVTESGSYAYLDFWVVSPGSEYELRVSTDTKTKTGSFLMELPDVVETSDGNYTLADIQGIVEASARVGFLVNTDTGNTESMLAYSESEAFEERYKSLSGVYQEKGEERDIYKQYSFTIYEPNGLKHSLSSYDNGDYVITKPLSYDHYMKTISEVDISGNLTVQGNSQWKTTNTGIQLEQILQSAIANKEGMNANTAKSELYDNHLQGQVGAYVTTGDFLTNTTNLYNGAINGIVDSEYISNNLLTAGATDDVFITKLERNTPQRIRMFIWIEGQDADCTNTSSIKASGFSLSIELSGATNE